MLFLKEIVIERDMFIDRSDAGQQLAELLQQYRGKEGVVYALPRGGVVVAAEIAKALNFPLDLILAHKIGHPYHSEYAIGAISESGHMVGKPDELQSVGEEWLENEKKREMKEIKRKREAYLKGAKEIPVKGKMAILVDDGIATGMTLRVGIQELKDKLPEKIIVAVPVSPKSTAKLIQATVDDFVAVEIPEDYAFLGAVGAYYEIFDQVEDSEVISILNEFKK